MKKIYLDYAATTPTDPLVIRAMEPYWFERFGNPSSAHTFGREAKKALEDARENVSVFLGTTPKQIVFTSGGTEANNQAILGAARRMKGKGKHIVSTKIEHHSVLEPLEYLEKKGFEVTYLDVTPNGRVDVTAVQEALREDTILVSIMHANNEMGAVQDIVEISKVVKEKDVFFHVDAVQTVGHIPVDVDALGVDLLSMSAHKFYGPKGVGALYIREGTDVAPFLVGGDQESGQRASTQNIPGIVGMSQAITLCREKMQEEAEEQIRLRDYMIQEMLEKIPGVTVNGDRIKRLPNNVHVSLEKIQAEELLMSLDMEGICASMGSACRAGAMEASHVLRAMQVPEELIYGALRVSIGRWTTQEDVDIFLEKLPGIIHSIGKYKTFPAA